MFCPSDEETRRFEYVRRHNLVRLFDSLIVQLVQKRPGNPVLHLRQWCEFQYISAFSHNEYYSSSLAEVDGYDPELPPDGLFGSRGSTSHRRSLALGLLSRDTSWNVVCEEGSETSSCATPLARAENKGRRLPSNCPSDPAEKGGEAAADVGTALAEIEKCVKDEGYTLFLCSWSLREVPVRVFACEHLTALDLSDNSLAELPPAISQLFSLEKLCLRSNQLERVPDEICGLPMLATLFLDENRLTALPDRFREMEQLRVLGLDWNDFQQIPAQLAAIPELSELYLIENPCVTSISVDLFGAFANLTLALDNFPSLVSGWGEGVPNVHMQWNKVFPDAVIPGLFLGSLRAAQHPRVYEELGITHVASIGRELQVVIKKGMKHVQINVSDMEDTNLNPFFDQVHAFIDSAIACGTAVLVHCFKGQSRSATMVISYLIKKRGWSYNHALNFVKTQSPRINPNRGFRSILKRYAVANATETPAYTGSPCTPKLEPTSWT
ncbi:Dual specificity protein phosphatase 1 [Diplonema papillatum]|nr:Dual specificity protein phosphatase 1 [Diplonema papillatum]